MLWLLAMYDTESMLKLESVCGITGIRSHQHIHTQKQKNRKDSQNSILTVARE